MANYDVDFEKITNASGNYVLIVLNESLNSSKSDGTMFKSLWKNAQGRIIVDGASNWLFNHYEEFGDPDYICGDMDSISKEAQAHFEKKLPQEKFVRLPDQLYTDFEKSVNFSIEQFKDKKIEHFIVTWAQSNRIDHILSCISTLIRHVNQNSLPIYLLDINNSLSIVLDKSKTIKVNRKSEWCSIIPVGEPATVSTTGFKWNLTDYELKFGELISSSNEFDQNETVCTIKCNKPVLFSMHLPA